MTLGVVLLKHSLDYIWSMCHTGIPKPIGGTLGESITESYFLLISRKFDFPARLLERTLIAMNPLWKYRNILYYIHTILLYKYIFILNLLWKYILYI